MVVKVLVGEGFEDNQGDIQQKPYSTERFCSTTNNLNTLALRTRIT
jgi:hypothetical protein